MPDVCRPRNLLRTMRRESWYPLVEGLQRVSRDDSFCEALDRTNRDGQNCQPLEVHNKGT